MRVQGSSFSSRIWSASASACDSLAIIDKIHIEFGKGLNVITGETGAGKSIIINSINAILGERMSKAAIRTGEDLAKVTAVFNTTSSKAKEITSYIPSLLLFYVTSHDPRNFYLLSLISLKTSCFVLPKSCAISVSRWLKSHSFNSLWHGIVIGILFQYFNCACDHFCLYLIYPYFSKIFINSFQDILKNTIILWYYHIKSIGWFIIYEFF